MLASFRRLSKSTVGTAILILFLLLIVASFALTDISNLQSGNLGGASSSTLVKVGDQEITDREMSKAMERRLAEVRQQNPEATYATVVGEFDAVLASLVDQRTLQAFANKNNFRLSKRLVDAEIANIPGTRGLDGKFSEQAYQSFLAQQRMTDQDVRNIISTGLMQRAILSPVATSPRVPVGVATPYASMLLEARQGEVASVPIAAFRAGLNPTDADLQKFYAANRNRYMVPEQRVLRLARIGPEQVAGVAASEQEVTAYYNANQATYGAKDIRTLGQVVVPDRNTAAAIAQRAKGGATLAAAAAPAGSNAAVSTLADQSRQAYTSVAGERAAAAVFGASSGAVVGPIESDFGWVVVKVESVRTEGGKSLAQARAEIAARLTADKRKNALTDLVTRIEDAIEDGSNLEEAAALGKLPLIRTPPVTATGAARGDPAFKFPADLAPALRAGFEISPNDDPVVETLPGESGFVLVAPGDVTPAAPAPLSSIRAQVAQDWITQQATQRARAVATAIAAKTARNVPLKQAVAEAGVALPVVRDVGSKRLDIARMGANVPAAIRMLFSLGAGKSRMVAEPQAGAFAVVKLNRIVPGNALLQPGLIGQVQREFQQSVAEEYARQFLASIRETLGISRNEKAIAEAKKRLSAS